MKQFLQKLTAVFLMFATCNAFAVGPISGGGGGGTPGGSGTYVQYNDGGVFGGEAAFAYDKTLDTLKATGSLWVGAVSSGGGNGISVKGTGSTTNKSISIQPNDSSVTNFYATDAGDGYFGGTLQAVGVSTLGIVNVGGASSAGTGVTIMGSGTTTNKALTIKSTTEGGTTTAYIQDNGDFYFGGGNTSTPTLRAIGGGDITIYSRTGGGTGAGAVIIDASRLLLNGQLYSATGVSCDSFSTWHGLATGAVAFKSATTYVPSIGIARYSTAENTLEVNSGTRGSALANIILSKVYYTSTVFDSAGTGDPDGAVTAGIGSTFRRTDGGAGTSFYVKESGTGNTGWVAK